ncbi:MAG: STAS domain-containing protein [Terriglobales bacterium]
MSSPIDFTKCSKRPQHDSRVSLRTNDVYISGPVIVLEVPERLNQADAEAFLGELRPFLESDHPRIVLDCSQVRYVDSVGIELLFRCVQQAMKHDGDLRLAAVSPTSGVILELLRVDCGLQMFENMEDAVQSFHPFSSDAIPQTNQNSSAYGAFAHLKAAG